MRQRGDAWELRVYQGRDPISNRKRWVTRTFHGGKREAQRALAALVTEMDSRPVTPKEGTVGQLLNRWYDNATDDFSPKTALEVRGFIDRNLIPSLGKIPLAKLGTEDLDRYYRELRHRGSKAGTPLAPATIRRIHGILHRALAQAIRWGWIKHNPASTAQVPRIPASDIAPPTPAQVARLFAVAAEDNPDLATFVLLAAATGARRSELVALRWSDCDLTKKTLRIARGLVIGAEGVVEKDTKTHSARNVSLDKTVTAALHAHHKQAEQRAAACDTSCAADAYIFSREADSSTPWRPDATTRAFAQLCKKAGLKNVRLHDLRHYVATRLLGAGVDVRTVAGRLGHRSTATTLNVYSHFLTEADQEAADVLGRIFDQAAKDTKMKTTRARQRTRQPASTR